MATEFTESIRFLAADMAAVSSPGEARGRIYFSGSGALCPTSEERWDPPTIEVNPPAITRDTRKSSTTGTNPSEYVLARKICKFKCMLSETNMCIFLLLRFREVNGRMVFCMNSGPAFVLLHVLLSGVL